MGAAEAMEAEGHTMTPSRRAVIERFEALVAQVEAIETRQALIIERLAQLEVAATMGETYLVAGLNDLRHLACRVTAALPPVPTPPAAP